jgi:hypothetical protein
MGLVRSLRPSAKRTGANRRNAKQSTGPRTPAGKQSASQNARRPAPYSPWTPEVMEIVGVDPGPWQEMYGLLLLEWRPAGPAEAMLVEDLANLHWAKRCLRRAQVAEALNGAQTQGFRSERAALEAECEPPRIRDSAMVGITGLRGVPNCPEKIGPAPELIDQLTELAVADGASDQFEAMFERLYGMHPTRVGLDFRDLFQRLAAEESASSPASDQMRAQLRSLMTEERDLLLEEQELDEREQAAEPVVAELVGPCRAAVPGLGPGRG